ncbi:MAG TPA: hypothetical protein VNB22_17495 [Pyrinomonadaceae bacterium]|nr:hypothetical protein [Pyrinomonadaceae bacterium]
MKEYKGIFVVIHIGLGIIALLMAVGGLFLSTERINPIALLFLGSGLFLYGLAGNNPKTVKAQTISSVAGIFMIIFAALTLFNNFFLK